MIKIKKKNEEDNGKVFFCLLHFYVRVCVCLRFFFCEIDDNQNQ